MVGSVQSIAAISVALLSLAITTLVYTDVLPLESFQAFISGNNSFNTKQKYTPPIVTPEQTAALLPLDFDALQIFVDRNSREELRWGTYRSGLYYGIRSRTFPYFVSAGLLWGAQHEDISQLRHECRQEDRLQKYGWEQHDGRKFGMQTIEDQFNRVNLKTYYLRLQDDDIDGWATRVQVANLEPRDDMLRRKKVDTTKLTLFFYVDLGCEDETVQHSCRDAVKNLMDVVRDPVNAPCSSDEAYSCSQVVVESEGAANSESISEAPLTFKLQVQLKTKAATIKSTELRFQGVANTNVLNVKDRLVWQAHRVGNRGDREVHLENVIEDDSTAVVVQAIIEADASAFNEKDVILDIVFNEQTSKTSLSKPIDVYVSETIGVLSQGFEQKFENIFQMSKKGLVSQGSSATVPFNASHIEFAQTAFSNLMGGMGYFYGSSLVQHDPNDPTIEESKPRPLFSAVPSRSFFPRGFLWDEGFHQMGIFPFDRQISQDVMAHWLGLMESDGYIAREQILGETARRRVPKEFIVQHVQHANPPTLFLCLEKMLEYTENSNKKEMQEFVKVIFPFLERWYHWFLITQEGPIVEDDAASFRWRGRVEQPSKLSALTLSSGLDDYPRAFLPNKKEMHVDLLTWMVKISGILANLAELVDLNEKKIVFESNKARFLKGLLRYHWNAKDQSFYDVGEHTNDGHLELFVAIRCRNNVGEIIDATASLEAVQTQRVKCPASHPNYLFPTGDGEGGLKRQTMLVPGTIRLQHVRHIGYVSIFPLLLKVLPPDSPQLYAVLQQLVNPKHLWSPYGIRSMSTQDMFYERENEPGDNPYWRGSIWINMNYLALDALHHYAQPSTGSPYQKDFKEAYDALRTNVISTIYGEYKRTGYLWEQYSGDIHAGERYGRGQRTHPFAGWTALIVNIMAEIY